MTFKFTPRNVRRLNQGGEYYVRVVSSAVLVDFNWTRPLLHRFPSGVFIGPNMSVEYDEKEFVVLKHNFELSDKKGSKFQVSNFYLAYKGRVYKPGRLVKERVKAFLKDKGLPLDSLAGKGELLACLRIIHALNLGFTLEEEYALE